MKIAQIFAPYLLILLVLSNLNWLVAWLSGEDYIPFNKQLEDAKILSFRMAIKSGQTPRHHDFVVAGTSRSIAAFNPLVISQGLAAGLGEGVAMPKGINLGNLCNSPLEFEHNWREHKLDFNTLILEFSPHILTRPTWRPTVHSLHAKYTLWTQEMELRLTGWVKACTGTSDIFYAKPRYIFHILKAWYESGLSAAELYYFMRCTINAYGGRMKADGHADFWSYLPDKSASTKLSKLYKSDAHHFDKTTRKAKLNEEEWQAYQRIILRVLSEGKRIVLVRPPVEAGLYAIENNVLSAAVEAMDGFLKVHPVPYLDMNPNPYKMMDKTHLDWYDAGEVSARLAEFILRETSK